MSRTTFITGANGFLGSYVAAWMLEHTDEHLAVFIRAADESAAREKLWKGWQLHMSGPEFWHALDRVTFVMGDLHQPRLGLSDEHHAYLVAEADSVLHIAASLNRKSSKACLNTNLRGTLSVIKLARAIADAKGLRRYSHVSTVAVAGQRDSELVLEDTSVEWDRSDYDPYARTKKFCEHMAHELLPDVQRTIFRPSIVMGDSRFPETAQFDMVRAFCVLADLPVVPLDPNSRLDIVNADWVGKAVALLHTKDDPEHGIYHLSSGLKSRTVGEVATATTMALGREPRFAGRLQRPFQTLVDTVAGFNGTKNVATLVASLLKVFLPYITYDTVFDNTRACTEVGEEPVPFTHYCADLYRYANRVGFEYPAVPLPARPTELRSVRAA